MSRRVYQNTGNEFSSRGLGSPGFGLLGGDDDDGLGIMGTHVNASRREASSRRMSAGPAYGRRSTGNLAASGMAVAGVSGSPSMRRPRRRSHTSSVPELQKALDPKEEARLKRLEERRAKAAAVNHTDRVQQRREAMEREAERVRQEKEAEMARAFEASEQRRLEAQREVAAAAAAGEKGEVVRRRRRSTLAKAGQAAAEKQAATEAQIAEAARIRAAKLDSQAERARKLAHMDSFHARVQNEEEEALAAALAKKAKIEADIEASRIRREQRKAEHAAQAAAMADVDEVRQRRLSVEEAQNAESLKLELERQLAVIESEKRRAAALKEAADRAATTSEKLKEVRSRRASTELADRDAALRAMEALDQATEESEQRRLAAASEKAQRASQFVGRVDSTQARAAALAEEQERAARLKAEAIEAQTLEAERRRVEAVAEAKARATVLADRVDVVGAKMKEAEKDQLELALEKERALQAALVESEKRRAELNAQVAERAGGLNTQVDVVAQRRAEADREADELAQERLAQIEMALQTADERSAAADQAVADRARKQLEHVDKAHHRRVLSDQEADELARAKEAAIAESLARSEAARQASLAAAASAPGVDDRLGRARTRRRSVDMDEMNQLAARNAKLDAALSDSERRKEAAMREAAARASASVDRVDKVRSRRSSLEELEAIQASQREFAIEMDVERARQRRETGLAESRVGGGFAVSDRGTVITAQHSRRRSLSRSPVAAPGL